MSGNLLRIDVQSSQLVKGDHVLKRNIYSRLSQFQPGKRRRRQLISQSDILDPKIGHVEHISGLRNHDKSGIGSAQIPCPRIKGIGSVLRPVITGDRLRHSTIFYMKARYCKLSGAPHFTPAYSLTADIEIK